MDINTYNEKRGIEYMGDAEQKIPKKCHRMMQELEKRAPQPIHYKELAFLCNISTHELGLLFNTYRGYFRNVERIETEHWTKYRLNLYLKLEEFEDKSPDIRIRDRIQWFFQKRKG